MQLVKVQIKKFLSISDIEVTPGQVTQIVGANNNGKTSFIKAIEFGMKGSNDGTLVKHGEDAAEVILEFDNELVVRRRLKADGTQNVSVKKGGFNADKPQSFLNSLLADGGFNPLDLLDPKSRTENLLKSIDLRLTPEELTARIGDASPIPLPPLDYNQHGLKVVETGHRYFYQRRAEANKAAELSTNRYVAMKEQTPPMPTEPPIDVTVVRAEIEAAKQKIAEEEAKRSSLAERQKAIEVGKQKLLDVGLSIGRAREEINRLNDQIERLNEKIVTLQETGDTQNDLITKAVAELNQNLPDEERLTILRKEIEFCNSRLVRKAEIDAIEQAQKRLQDLHTAAANDELFAVKLNDVVKLLGSDFKSQLMKKTALPVEGLTFEDGQFFLDGSSIDNLSTSKTLRLAVAIARKLAGPAKLICVDGAELLDADSYAALRAEIENDGFVYFITKVGEAFAQAGDKVVTMQNGVAV